MSSADDWRGLGGLYLQKAKDAENLYREWRAAHAAYGDAYAERFAASGGGVDLVNAAHMAGGDPRRQDAGKKAEWFREEATMYAQLTTAAFTAAASADTRRQELAGYMQRPRATYGEETPSVKMTPAEKEQALKTIRETR